MNLKVKLLYPDSKLPTRAHPTDAGLDLYCHRRESPKGVIHSAQQFYYTGIAVEIPEGHVGLIFPRSSISNTNHRLVNAVGVIDHGYDGEVQLRFDESPASALTVVQALIGMAGGEVDPERIARARTNHTEIINAEYQVGDRIGQLVIVPCLVLDVEEVKELSESVRGRGGFGSTGIQ